MKKVYESVEDIDLFAGLTLEKKFEDALIGETFICLIADVFARLRFGDRFFYDLEGKEEMNSIREPKKNHLISIIKIRKNILTNLNKSKSAHFFTFLHATCQQLMRNYP